MISLFRKILYTGTVTEDYDTAAVPLRFRGEVTVQRQQCGSCRACEQICPTGAIIMEKGTLCINQRACVFCGRCVEICEDAILQHSGQYKLATLSGSLSEQAGDEMRQKIRKVLGRSLHIRHVDVGSCNACDFEMSALLNPVYDITQYGIDFVASPRHADLLMVTGVVTRNLRPALEATLKATPKPRLVMAVGACACSGKVFGETYALEGPVDRIVPVDVYVPGCPPRPQALLYGLLLALDRL